MKKTLILMFSAVCIASASQSGAEIFKRCGVCHGDKGQKHSLNLTKFIAGMDKSNVVEILKQYKAKERNKYGLGTMMQGQAAKLSNEDIEAVATYISNLEPIKEEVVIKKTIDTTDGAKIFKQCSVCHGAKGHKRSLNVSKYIAGMKKEEIFEILQAYQSGKRNLYGYGSMMKGQAKKLSEKQKHAVAEYVESLEPFKEKSKKSDGNTKRISKDEVTWNEFMRWYFDKSTDPNETFKAAKKAWEKRNADIKAGIPVEPIVTKRTLAEQHKAKLKERAYGDANAKYKEIPTKERMQEIEKKIAPLQNKVPQEVVSTKEDAQKPTQEIKKTQKKVQKELTSKTTQAEEKIQSEVTKNTKENSDKATSEVEKIVEKTPKEEESSSWWSW